MSQADIEYLKLGRQLFDLSKEDQVRKDRTEVGTYSIFGHQMRFDLSKEFPILTSKKVNFNAVLHELLWFINGDTNIKYLLENNVHIWTDWRYKEYLEDFKNLPGTNKSEPLTFKQFEQSIIESNIVAEHWGNIGKGYGHQWRNFGEVQNYKDHNIAYSFLARNHKIVEGFDQLKWVIDEIKTNPTSRRLIVSGWNPHEIDKVDLPPCHTLFQFFVKDGKLSCQLYQRSADVFLGVPFNIASYALLTIFVAKTCGLKLGDFVWTGGDVHLYSNHVQAIETQLHNKQFDAPKLVIDIEDSEFNIFNIDATKIKLENYQHSGFIKAPVAV